MQANSSPIVGLMRSHSKSAGSHRAHTTLTILRNFLTTPDMTVALEAEIRGLTRSLTLCSILLVLGRASNEYQPIYEKVEALPCESEFPKLTNVHIRFPQAQHNGRSREIVARQIIASLGRLRRAASPPLGRLEFTLVGMRGTSTLLRHLPASSAALDPADAIQYHKSEWPLYIAPRLGDQAVGSKPPAGDRCVESGLDRASPEADASEHNFVYRWRVRRRRDDQSEVGSMRTAAGQAAHHMSPRLGGGCDQGFGHAPEAPKGLSPPEAVSC